MLISKARKQKKFLRKDPMFSPFSEAGSKKAVSVVLEGLKTIRTDSGGIHIHEVSTPPFLCGEEKGLFFLRGHNSLRYFEKEPSPSGPAISGSRMVSFAFGDTIEAYLFDSALSPRVRVSMLDNPRPFVNSEGGAILPHTLSRIIDFVRMLPENILLRGGGYYQGKTPLREQLLLALSPFDATMMQESTSRHGRVVKSIGALLTQSGKVEAIEKRRTGTDSQALWEAELRAYRALESVFGEGIIPRGTGLSRDGMGLIHENLRAGGKILIEFDSGIPLFMSHMDSCPNSDELHSLFEGIISHFAAHGVTFGNEMEHTIALSISPETGEGRLVFMDLDHAIEPVMRACKKE